MYTPGVEVGTKAARVNCDGSSLIHVPSLSDSRGCCGVCCSAGATAVCSMAGPCWGWRLLPWQAAQQPSALQLFPCREQELCFPSSTCPPVQIKLQTETTLRAYISLSLVCLADRAWRNDLLLICLWRKQELLLTMLNLCSLSQVNLVDSKL